MNNVVRKIRDDAAPGNDVERVVEETGRVLEIREDGAALVRTASGEHEARRAVSCLVAVEVDDLVLMARSPLEGAFVLAVLRRDGSATTTLTVAGDLDVRLASGRLSLAAQEGVDLLSAREVSVTAGGLRVNATEGHVVLESLSFLGDAVRAEIDRVKIFAQSLDSVLERFSQRVQRSYRTVTETDQVRAQRIDYTADKTMRLHGEHALITADELVKVDAEQIHLG